MKKVELINPEEYFVESRKAVQIALEKEEYLHNEMPMQNKLDYLKKRKKETNSAEEYEAIEALEKKIEKDIKFNYQIPLVPEEYKDVIKRNAEIEAAEFDKKLTELKKELKDQLPYLQNVLLPLVINIQELDKLKVFSHNVDIILNHEFRENQAFRAQSRVFKPQKKAKYKLTQKTEEVINSISKLSV